MHDLLRQLAGGDRRSIGQSDRVVRDVLKQPLLFAIVVDGLRNSDPLVRMRCADVVEKATRLHPDWLVPHKVTLLTLAARTSEQELRWHLAQMLPRLPLTPAETRRVITRLLEYLADESRIVKAFSMQALADFALRDRSLKGRVLPLLETLARTGSPAMRARGRRLVTQLQALEAPSKRRGSRRRIGGGIDWGGQS